MLETVSDHDLVRCIKLMLDMLVASILAQDCRIFSHFEKFTERHAGQASGEACVVTA